MARKKNRMAVLKRQREQKKAEKREAKRLKKLQRKDAGLRDDADVDVEELELENGPEDELDSEVLEDSPQEDPERI